MYDLGKCKVSSISQDRKKASITIDRRSFPTMVFPFTVYCFTGNNHPASADAIGGGNWAAYCSYDIMRETLESFNAPMFAQIEVNGKDTPVAHFTHFGTYELLHLKNDTNLPITVVHQGFNCSKPWYQASTTVWFYDGFDPTKISGEWEGDVDSPEILVMPHIERTIISWYIPSGFKIDNAQLIATINGKAGITSTNTISSNVSFQRGHAYHMYATWDGKELKFDKSNKLLDELGLGFTHLDMQEGGGYGFTTGREGHLKLETTDPSVASAIETDDIGELHVDILAHSIGTAIITITDTRTGEKSQIEVVVTEAFNFGALVHVGETEIVTMKNENGVYEAYSENPSIATCGVNANKISVTGKKQGETIIHVTEKTSNKQYTIEVCVYGDSHGSAEVETCTVNGVSFNMVKVEGGSFMMGWEGSDWFPLHKVTVSSYYIGQCEVTQELWTAVMGEPSASTFKGDKLPVDRTSWNGCYSFINKLNEITGMNFYLPTEAQWNFAALGGIYSKGYQYPGSNVLDEVAWTTSNSEGHTHDVGQLAPNELGIYDMCGNVSEWCFDYYHVYPTEEEIDPVATEYHTIGALTNPARLYKGWCYDNSQWGKYLQPINNVPWQTISCGFRLAMPFSSPIAYNTCPDDNHPHLIDLGLPSGTKWACCNIGAKNPCEGGLYFAWGETEGYTDNISDGRLFNSSSYKCTNPNYGAGNITVLLPEDDAAYVNWGGSWRMPTYEDFDELLNNTYQEWTTQNDVVGRRLTSKIKGNSIFLPSAGERYKNELNFKGVIGNYWTASIYNDSSKDAWLYFSDIGRSYLCNLYRYTGRTIRPVVSSSSTSVSEGDEL